MRQGGKYIIIGRSSASLFSAGRRVDRLLYRRTGDTGEKDEEAAERIASAYPQKVRAVFLHTVYKEKGGIAATPPAYEDRKVAGVPVLYFRTYVGAAVKAYRMNLIDKAALRRVAASAVEELKAQHSQLESHSSRAQRGTVKHLLPSAIRERLLATARTKQAARWWVRLPPPLFT